MPLRGKNAEGLKFVLGILATAVVKVGRLVSTELGAAFLLLPTVPKRRVLTPNE